MKWLWHPVGQHVRVQVLAGGEYCGILWFPARAFERIREFVGWVPAVGGWLIQLEREQAPPVPPWLALGSVPFTVAALQAAGLEYEI